ncbi:collagen alpha-2(I) chain-like [Oryctolagus cuniculus]|uniref:collagen alpha-2(I) chain-like n=1 Tax=Oryctolagus cuniculus TaxID=9986 RepID=UPI00387A38F8
MLGARSWGGARDALDATAGRRRCLGDSVRLGPTGSAERRGALRSPAGRFARCPHRGSARTAPTASPGFSGIGRRARPMEGRPLPPLRRGGGAPPRAGPGLPPPPHATRTHGAAATPLDPAGALGVGLRPAFGGFPGSGASRPPPGALRASGLSGQRKPTRADLPPSSLPGAPGRGVGPPHPLLESTVRDLHRHLLLPASHTLHTCRAHLHPAAAATGAAQALGQIRAHSASASKWRAEETGECPMAKPETLQVRFWIRSPFCANDANPELCWSQNPGGCPSFHFETGALCAEMSISDQRWVSSSGFLPPLWSSDRSRKQTLSPACAPAAGPA